MELRTGDIILTCKNSLIVKFMRLFQKDPVHWGHVLVVKDSTTAWEAHWTLRETNIQKVLDKEREFLVMRMNNLTKANREAMKKIAPKLLGYPYGVWRIVLQALDHIFNTNWFTKRADCKYIQVCSSYAAWIYYVACKYKFNDVNWQSCEPDDVEDDFILYKDRWTLIGRR